MGQNLRRKFLILAKYGTETVAAKEMQINYCNLSRIINGWRKPNQQERGKLIKGLGMKKYRQSFEEKNDRRP